MAKRERRVPSPLTPTPAGGLDLSRARQRHGITLDQIVEKTKITLRYLKAIESENFDELPGGIFAVNYLRQYADAAGFDSNRLVDYYNEKSVPLAPEVPNKRAGSSESKTLFERLFA